MFVITLRGNGLGSWLGGVQAGIGNVLSDKGKLRTS